MSEITYSDDLAALTSADTQPDSQASLLHNFGVASLLVVAGVVISGFLLTSERSETNFSLPALPIAAWQTEASAGSGSDSWIDLADQAFASGRITEPANDNALHYFHQAVLANPADQQAREGLDKVVTYVISDAETAVYESDWAQARRAAETYWLCCPSMQTPAVFLSELKSLNLSKSIRVWR